MKKIMVLLLTACLFSGCSKDEALLYSENSRIYFALQKAGFYGKYNTQKESSPKLVTINFFGKNSAIVDDTVKLNLRITGVPSEQEKRFNLTVTSVDAQEGNDYVLPDKDMLFPANVRDATYRIIVKRTAKIRVQPSLLKVSLAASDDFQLGPQADTLNYAGDAAIMSITSLSLVARDIAMMPANWDSKLKTYFGEYSEVRYRFVIDVLGISTFADSLPIGTLTGYRTRLRTALTAYNTANPQNPLKDENGKLITF